MREYYVALRFNPESISTCNSLPMRVKELTVIVESDSPAEAARLAQIWALAVLKNRPTGSNAWEKEW